MTTPFFDSVESDTEQRATTLLGSMTQSQIDQVEALGHVKSAYYQDLKRVLEDEFAGWLSDTDVDAQTLKNLTLAASNLALRAITKFSLSMGEIVAFGRPDGIEFESTHME